MIKYARFFSVFFAVLMVAEPMVAQELSLSESFTTYEGLAKVLSEKPRNFFLVDTRTVAEFRNGRIPGAVNIPVERIPNNPPTRDLNATIVLYCRFGNRSERAKDILESMGYKKVYVFGRMIQWKGELVK